MRFPLLFKKVSDVISIDSNRVDLPNNISIAVGETRADKYRDALRILKEDPKVNAVVAIGEQRPKVSAIRDTLYCLAENKKIRVKMDLSKPDSLSGLFERFSKYLIDRKRNLHSGVPDIEATINMSYVPHIIELWEQSINDCVNLKGVSLSDSIVVYVPEYGKGPNGYINTHVDHSDRMDVRIVECLEGSGTILCADEDFKIIKGLQGGHERYGIDLLKAKIRCWSLMTGSSVIIRGPSEQTWEIGARPCVHAHGIGGRDKPEQRMTMRHDLVFNAD